MQWAVSQSPVGYAEAVAAMEARVRQIKDGSAAELVWLLEHPPLYTAGTSANARDLLNPGSLPVYKTGRGGQFTYHGPGQRVAYVMADVKNRFGNDVRAFTASLETWIIGALATLGIAGSTIAGQTGVWIYGDTAKDIRKASKIAAIGLRVRHGISFHGVSINVNPNLDHYQGIVPCGLAGSLVTSLAELGCNAPLSTVDQALRSAFIAQFGGQLNPAPAPVF